VRLSTFAIDRERSAARIDRDIEALAGPFYSLSADSVRRYAYTDAYQRAVAYVRLELEMLDFTVSEDAVGNLIGRNRPDGVPAWGLGSHVDSTRNGGRFDGTLGVVAALEACRLNAELGLGLPLQVMSFLEEAGSGFGTPMLGSRIMAQRISEEELRSLRSVDDGRPFWEHAVEAGYAPECWRDSLARLDDLRGWIEIHIEQDTKLEDEGRRLGLVTGIAGLTQGDLVIHGRADHAGSTPMHARIDPGPVAATCLLELERLARAAGAGTVATVGEIEMRPGQISSIPDSIRLSLDVRSVDAAAMNGVVREIVAFAELAAYARGATATYSERHTIAPTALDGRLLAALEAAADQAGEPHMRMHSHALHDTALLADHIASALLFVPCKDGISHSPLESACGTDAAAAVEIALSALVAAERSERSRG
jgi:hydantoinase/carbamoylase family amidase